MQPGDIVLSCYSNKVVDAVGVVKGEPEWHDEYGSYKRLRKVRWLAKDIRENIYHRNGDKVLTLSTLYKLSIPVAEILAMIGISSEADAPETQDMRNYVFIIDEINRGNMAKIFGELMTLIEESKRLGAKEEKRVHLPYSGYAFGVPGNVYIIGTMNTADRSIALMDAALRRRFSFVEIPPEPKLLEGTVVAGIRVDRLLDLLNRRIEALLDRDHVLGHAAFLGLKENADMAALAAIMKNAVLPLLQEYFYNDYEKIRLVLGDNQKTQPDDVKFIDELDEGVELFGPHTDADGTRYSIDPDAFEKPVAYRYLGLDNGAGEDAAAADEH
ncbi:MAG: AAA family ATPase [Desulfovibrio sp.]|nr:AAA family ATPase [Desulfovibrio sp.]